MGTFGVTHFVVLCGGAPPPDCGFGGGISTGVLSVSGMSCRSAHDCHSPPLATFPSAAWAATFAPYCVLCLAGAGGGW